MVEMRPARKHHDRAQSADVDRDIDHQALVGPARQRGHQNEVRGRTDGQKFGNALDERQHRDMQKRQIPPLQRFDSP